MFAIVDSETTGFDAPVPIELAALRLTPAWTVERAFYRRWQPAKPVEPGAATKNGYTPEAWAGCEPVTAGDLVAFSEFVTGCRWVGSYPDFDFRTLEPLREGARLPRWPLATHRMPNIGTLGGPLIDAMGGGSGGQEAILAALTSLGMPVPPIPEWLAEKAGGRVGPHTAMGDAWAAAHALRCLWIPIEEYWRGVKERVF